MTLEKDLLSAQGELAGLRLSGKHAEDEKRLQRLEAELEYERNASRNLKQQLRKAQLAASMDGTIVGQLSSSQASEPGRIKFPVEAGLNV